jgi:Holliday junction resolvase
VLRRKATRLAPLHGAEPRETDQLEHLIASDAKSQSSKLQPRRGGRRHRVKGDRVERELVDRHKILGVHAERYPLSGASRFRGSGHDVDIYLFGRDDAPLVCEVKGRKGGAGFTTLEKWLGDFDVLFLRRNHADPLVVLPWRVWACIVDRVRR